MTQHYRLRCWSVVLTTGLFIALASAGLVACGYYGSTQSSASQTQPQSQGTQLRTTAQTTSPPTRVIPTPTQTAQPLIEPQLQPCGFVFGFGALELVPRDLGGEQAESCFWQAFQHCRPATLVFTAGTSAKFHTTLKHTFTIHNENGTCLITDVQQIGASSNTTNSICTGLVRHPRALDVLSCGQEGTVAVLGA